MLFASLFIFCVIFKNYDAKFDFNTESPPVLALKKWAHELGSIKYAVLEV